MVHLYMSEILWYETENRFHKCIFMNEFYKQTENNL